MRGNLNLASTLLLIAFMAASTGFATVDKRKRSPPPTDVTHNITQTLMFQGPISAADLFERTQYILFQYFSKIIDLKPEPDYQQELQPLMGQQSLAELNKMLPYFDGDKQFDRFSAFENTGSGVIHVYQDRDVRKVADYEVSLAPDVPAKTAFGGFHPTRNQPLAGLRIALDPGHMGGDIWDQRTGKFVTDPAGHKISEGVINLQTCLLLKDRFEKEGATVLVTRETLAPVTSISWDNLDLKNYIPDELFNDTLEPWFQQLLEEAPPGKDLEKIFSQSSHVKEIFSEKMRSDFFILNEDLEARTKIIQNFQPDITLVIHYDAFESTVSASSHDGTKVYVAGSFLPTEFASRGHRSDLAKHIFEPYWWNQSVSLARSLITQLETKLKIGPDRGTMDGDAIEIEPGLQARDLSLTRRITEGMLAYVECLFYNDPKEFKALLAQNHSMTIGGINTPYSDRLVQVVDSLETGVLNFAQSL